MWRALGPGGNCGLHRPPWAGVGMPVVIGPAPAGPANGPLANQPGPDVPCQRREPLMRRWYGSGREGLVELFDANADVGVADVVKQRGELRLADSPAGLLQPLDHLGQPCFQAVEAVQGG